jgi:hypothetical protein
VGQYCSIERALSVDRNCPVLLQAGEGSRLEFLASSSQILLCGPKAPVSTPSNCGQSTRRAFRPLADLVKPRNIFSYEDFPELSSAPYEEAGRLFACGRHTDGRRLLQQALSDLREAIDYLEPGGALSVIAVSGVSAFMALGQLPVYLDDEELTLRSDAVEDRLKN